MRIIACKSDRRALRGIWWLAAITAAAAGGLMGGCPTNSNPGPTPGSGDPPPALTGSFSAAPLTVCAGEPVTLNWNVSVPDTALPPTLNLFAATFGGVVPNTVKLDVPALVGTRVVNPTASTGFSFSAVSDPNDPLRGAFYASQAVTVLPANAPLNLTLTIGWGCNLASDGGPGWETVRYAAGQYASTNVQLVGVRNVSGFPIRLSFTRGSSPTPNAVTLGQNESSTALNGGLFLAQAWTATPSPSDLFGGRPQTCDELAANSGLSPPPDIRIQVTLACGTE